MVMILHLLFYVMPAPGKSLTLSSMTKKNKLEMGCYSAEISSVKVFPDTSSTYSIRQALQKRFGIMWRCLCKDQVGLFNKGRRLFDEYDAFVAIVNENMISHTTPYGFRSISISKPTSLIAKKNLKKQELSTSIVDPWPMLLHTTSEPALLSLQTPSPQPTAISSHNNQSGTSSNSKTHATVYDGLDFTDQFQRKAPEEKDNVARQTVPYSSEQAYWLPAMNVLVMKAGKQLRREDDTIRNLDAQINIMKVLRCMFPLKLEMAVRYQAESPSEWYNSSGPSTSGVHPKCFAPGNVQLSGFLKVIPPPKRVHWPNQPGGKTTSGANKSAKRAPRNHRSLRHFVYIANYDMVDLLKGSRTTNLYSISLNDMMSASPVCLLTKASSTKSWLWHRRLNHLNFGTLNELARKNLVRGLPMLKYDKDHLCPSCQKEYQQERKYVLVIVDDYTRFGWVRFLRTKDETPQVIEKFIVKTQRALNATVRFVRTDNGTEFVNKTLDGWFESAESRYRYFVGYAPPRRRYRYLQQMNAQIRKTFHVAFDELTEGLTSVQTSSGLAPQQMTSVSNSTELELTALQSGTARSALLDEIRRCVKNKARLVAEGLSSGAGLIWEAFAPVASIRIDSDSSLLTQRPDSESLYGLKQAPRAWYYDKQSAFLIKSGFTKGVGRSLLSSREKAGKHLLLEEILKMFVFDSCTPMTSNGRKSPNLDADKGGKLIDPTRFRGMAMPTEMHLTAIKRIFRYLKGTINMGLWYSKDSGFELKAFADADYAGCHDTRRRIPIEERDVVPPGCSIHTVIIDPHGIRG
ncbi:retrovirus-related pol polyprotein from transposon TNT 1-94 [Tanacetum coccineum]